MEIFILVAILYGVFLYVMITGSIAEKKSKQKYREYMRQLYGSMPDRSYSEDELYRISRYYNRFKGNNNVDDITWNDLNMDEIYAHINFTQSSSGEEQLYSILRQPLLSDKENWHKNLDKHVKYMMDNEAQRLDTVMLFSEIGKTGKYSLYDYIDYLDDLGARSNTKHYFMIILLVLSIVVIFFNTSLGVAFVIGTACLNMVTYMKEKGVAQAYVTSFAYIIRMLGCADKIIKLDYSVEMKDYVMGLQNIRKQFNSFENHSGLVLKMNSTSGNIDDMIMDYVKMLTHIDIIQFNRMLDSVKRNKESIYELSKALGYLDVVVSIAYFRAALSHYCVPDLTSDKNVILEIKNGFHPLLSHPIANNLSQQRGMVLTGSNASGKSTFLKMVAINAILAQTIHTCAADHYTGNYYRIYSSMSLRDNLTDGESYYIVEIKALKRIVAIADKTDEIPLLCFVDEVLRGTNTVERIAASVQILKKLSKKGILCFAATHDIELTHLLEDYYDNFHFKEEIKDGDILFSYKLLEGRAHTRNAIKLLEIIGFSADIISKADFMANEFLNTGEWRK